MLIKLDAAGTLLDIVNKGESYLDASYASVTAPEIVYLEISVDGEVFDGVWARESHSWWTNAGGKLLPIHGLPPGSRLVITSTGPCALRIDWG